MYGIEHIIISASVGLVVGLVFSILFAKIIASNRERQKRKELDRIREDIKGKTEEVLLLSKSIEDKDKAIESAHKKVKEQDELLAKKNKEIATLQSQIKEQKNQLNEATQSVHKHVQKLEEAQESLDQKSLSLEKAGKELQSLQQALKDKESIISSQQSELKNLSQSKEELERQHNDLQEDMRQRTEDVEILKQKCLAYEKKMDEQNNVLEDFKKKEEDYKRQIESEQKQTQEIQTKYNNNAQLQAQTTRKLQKILELLQSAELPENISVKEEPEENIKIEEPHFPAEEEGGMDGLTVQLAEQEKQLQEKEESIKSLKKKLQDMESNLAFSEGQDNIIKEQMEQLKKYESQLTEIGLIKAQLADKNDMIQQYIDQIGLLEEKNKALVKKVEAESSIKESLKKTSAIDAIEIDPNLTSAHKKTMVMLYSQYTTPRKALRDKMTEEVKQEKTEESAPGTVSPAGEVKASHDPSDQGSVSSNQGNVSPEEPK